MTARWRLGQALAQVERKPGRINLSRTETNSFRALLKKIGLDKSRAVEAQRIGTLPEPELERA